MYISVGPQLIDSFPLPNINYRSVQRDTVITTSALLAYVTFK